MLGEQFSNGSKRSPLLPKFDDDIFGWQEMFKPLLMPGGEFRHCLADTVWIKCGHRSERGRICVVRNGDNLRL